MNKSYIGLLTGLAFSILLVYLLIVVNFQSWLDPFLIISALPAALCGNCVVSLSHRNTPQRSRAHRGHHVHGRGHGELNPGGELRSRADGRIGR